MNRPQDFLDGSQPYWRQAWHLAERMSEYAISVAELGHVVGVSPECVKLWLSGKWMIDGLAVVKLARYFSCSPALFTKGFSHDEST